MPIGAFFVTLVHMHGILLALVALLGWGFADFYAQRAARKLGISATLFSGSVFGLVALAPFAWGDLALLAVPRHAALLALAAAIGVFTALFSLEAFRQGKLAVIEPIMGLELPLTVLLAVALRGERFGLLEGAAFAVIFLGVTLAASSRPLGSRLRDGGKLERGVLLGIVGAVGIAASNYVTGVASQDISPVLAVWSGRAAFTVIFGGWLMWQGRLGATARAVRAHAGLAFGVAALYLVAFTAFAVGTTLAPISVVTTIGGGYIVLAVLLGVFLGRERLTTHQKAGVAAALGGILALSILAA